MRSSFERLAIATSRLTSPQEIEAFISELLTPSELHDLTLRWELMELLQKGIPQRKIAAALGISLCKITRGSKTLKRQNSITARLLAQMRPATGSVPHAGTDVPLQSKGQARR